MTATKLSWRYCWLRRRKWRSCPSEVPHWLHGRLGQRPGNMARKVRYENNGSKHDASTIHAKVVIRLEGPRSSNQPHGRLSVVRWIACTFEPYQKPSRERRNTPKGMSFAFITRSMHDIKSVSWASLKKEIVGAASGYWRQATSLKKWGQAQRHAVQHVDS